MIITKIKGGLGNQLFQYAAARAFSITHSTELKLDISAYEADTLRGFELSNFAMNIAIATDAEIDSYEQPFFQKILARIKPYYQRKIYKEPFFHFDPNFTKIPSDVYAKGYFQSEKYFINSREILLKEINLQGPLIENVKSMGEQLKNSPSVSVHIRRGDYNNPAVRDYHGILEIAYYENAITLIKKQHKDCLFYVFTDDEIWVRNNFKLDTPLEFISASKSTTHYEDFYLMSCCRHNIIANSSFSWWAAWLNENKGKTVIAPKSWFNNGPKDTADLIPANWIRI